MKKIRSIFLCLLFLLSSSLSLCIYNKRWMNDVEKNGIEFEKLRYSCNDIDTISIIGYLKSDNEISGYPCKKGWVHFTKEWKLKLFCISEEAEVNGIHLPEGSWVIIPKQGSYTTVVYPSDTIIQGFPVKGGGGSKGVHTQFYKSGLLKSFFPSTTFVRDGIKYKKSVFHPVNLSPDSKISGQ